MLSYLRISVNDVTQLYIGDNLPNTSCIISVPPSKAEVELQFNKPVNAIYVDSVKPPVVASYLPQKKIVVYGSSVLFHDYNYLGNGESIYLLDGSRIVFNTIVEGSKTDQEFEVCIFLFDDHTNFADFIAYQTQSLPSQVKCLPTTSNIVSWSFDITKESQYYIGISINEGLTVISNVSVTRTYYNLSHLIAESSCSNSKSCNLITCQKICARTSDSYIIIEANGNTGLTQIQEDAHMYEQTFIIITVVFLLVIFLLLTCCIGNEIIFKKLATSYEKKRHKNSSNNTKINEYITDCDSDSEATIDSSPELDLGPKVPANNSPVLKSNNFCHKLLNDSHRILESDDKLPLLKLDSNGSEMSFDSVLQDFPKEASTLTTNMLGMILYFMIIYCTLNNRK